MIIACQSPFLNTGFRELGHTVLELPRKFAGATLRGCLDDFGQKVDLVILELWGKTCIPQDIDQYRGKITAYAIDGPLNEYWLGSAGRMFSCLFVDQLSSTRRLLAQGVNAHWLPLSAQRSYFREPVAKKYALSFVGNTSSYRTKRRNLLNYLKQHTDVAHFENVSLDAMQDICAASHIVLNENLFSGLTLRVFQGMASGSLVLTEAGGIGVDKYFREGEHFVSYTPETILSRIDRYLNDTKAREQLAVAGQTYCREHHLARFRAKNMLQVMLANNADRAPSSTEIAFYAARSRVYLARRFGGRIGTALRTLKEIATQDDRLSGEACLQLGDIAFRRNNQDAAHDYYRAALEKGSILQAQCKLAFLHATQENVTLARQCLGRAMPLLAKALPADNLDIIRRMKDLARNLDSIHTPAEAFFALGLLAQAQGQICQMGFLRQQEERLPEVALDFALHAYDLAPSQEALALALECAAAFGMAGEMIPTLLDAIRQGLLDDAMIAKTAELATSYYDFELARNLVRSLGKRLR